MGWPWTLGKVAANSHKLSYQVCFCGARKAFYTFTLAVLSFFCQELTLCWPLAITLSLRLSFKTDLLIPGKQEEGNSSVIHASGCMDVYRAPLGFWSSGR